MQHFNLYNNQKNPETWVKRGEALTMQGEDEKTKIL